MNLPADPQATRRSDDFASIEHAQRQLVESIEMSKELMRRSQRLLDQHRSGSGARNKCPDVA